MAIHLDVSSVQSAEELHFLLARAFGFPDYYGNNWDAFDECIRDFPPEGAIHIVGLQGLGNALPRDAELLKLCLQGFAAEMPSRSEVYVS